MRKSLWSRAISFGTELLVKNAVKIFTVIIGLITAYAAGLVEVLKYFSPLSWVLGGLIGMCLSSLTYALVGYARIRHQLADIRERIAISDFINPHDQTFESRRIRVTDLLRPTISAIENKTFVNCDIIGPANIVVRHCTLRGSSGNLLDAFVASGAMPLNATVFLNCTFTNCSFYMVTFVIPVQFIDDFARHEFRGLNWLTALPQPTASSTAVAPQQNA